MAFYTKTLNDMEMTAKEEADGSCCKRIDGKWLEVICFSAIGDKEEYFKYVYNHKQITRTEAENVFQYKLKH